MGSNPIIPDIQFDEPTHTYTVNGEEMPSVTTILADVGITRKDKYPMFAATRGKDIHKLIQLFDENDLDMGSLDDNQFNHLTRWQMALTALGIEKPDHELIVFHPTMGYAGTVDAVHRDTATLIEIKSGNKERWHPIQPVAYKMAYEAYFGEEIKRIVLVYTKAEVKDYLKVIDNADDLGLVFAAAVEISRWKNETRRNKSRDPQYDCE
ncbi:MAG: hypothetical protein WC455_13690 [Dehalococcoidia bacterium]|jgi:CRISPR/Cas system-associated exonuclease Cas4 (RecB family)